MTTDIGLPTPSLLATLKAWSEQGWLRRLDSAFAGFMTDLCPAAPAPVVMAAALVAHWKAVATAAWPSMTCCGMPMRCSAGRRWRRWP